jgi:hypothetical protein
VRVSPLRLADSTLHRLPNVGGPLLPAVRATRRASGAGAPSRAGDVDGAVAALHSSYALLRDSGGRCSIWTIAEFGRKMSKVVQHLHQLQS